MVLLFHLDQAAIPVRKTVCWQVRDLEQRLSSISEAIARAEQEQERRQAVRAAASLRSQSSLAESWHAARQENQPTTEQSLCGPAMQLHMQWDRPHVFACAVCSPVGAWRGRQPTRRLRRPSRGRRSRRLSWSASRSARTPSSGGSPPRAASCSRCPCDRCHSGQRVTK